MSLCVFDPANHYGEQIKISPSSSVAWLAPYVSTLAACVIMVKRGRHLSRIYTNVFKETRLGAGWGNGFA
jgi:hypothetical protein